MHLHGQNANMSPCPGSTWKKEEREHGDNRHNALRPRPRSGSCPFRLHSPGKKLVTGPALIREDRKQGLVLGPKKGRMSFGSQLAVFSFTLHMIYFTYSSQLYNDITIFTSTLHMM